MAIHYRDCQWCEKPFTTKYKKQVFCCDKCRYEHHEETKRDMTAYGDVQFEMEPGKTRVSGRGARNKGARGEREVCHLIAGITGDDVSRNIGQSRDGGHDVDWGPFAIEVKTQQTVSMPAWQQQVMRSVVGTDKVPCVSWRRRGEEWWVALPMAKFIEIFHVLRTAAEASLKKNE